MLKLLAATCVAAMLAAPVHAASLSTGFAGGNGSDGNTFDIQIGAQDIVVTALELNLNHADANLELYYRLGSYVGHTGSLADWTLWDAATALPTVGINAATAWDVADLGFSAGLTYGIYVTTTDTRNVAYTNGTGAGNVAAADAGLTIFEGIGGQYGFASINSPRIWNGTIEYETTASTVPLPAALPLALIGFGALAALGRRRA